MRDLKKIQLSEKAEAERKRIYHTRQHDEEWDSQFQSTRQSSDFSIAPRVEYNHDVESALEKILGKEGLAGARREGRDAVKNQNSDDEEPEEDNQEDQEEDEEDEKNDDNEDEEEKDEEKDKEDDEDQHEEDAEENNEDDRPQSDTKQNQPNKDEIAIPIQRKPKPWELDDKRDRTEIIVGVRYNKDFENLFDDRQILRDRKPQRVVRIKAHFSKEYIVGLQFSYMTSQEELIDGKFNGDKKVTLNNLSKVQYEIQYREKIQSITVHFSKGIHWIELKTNEGRVLLIGKKQQMSKAVTQTKNVETGEEIAYISGGYAGKDCRFTYLAFHLTNGWDRPEDHFPNDEQEEPEQD